MGAVCDRCRSPVFLIHLCNTQLPSLTTPHGSNVGRGLRTAWITNHLLIHRPSSSSTGRTVSQQNHLAVSRPVLHASSRMNRLNIATPQNQDATSTCSSPGILFAFCRVAGLVPLLFNCSLVWSQRHRSRLLFLALKWLSSLLQAAHMTPIHCSYWI